MVELFVLGMLVMGALAVAAVIGFVLFLIKTLIWIVMLPIRLVMWMLWIPIGLTMGALGLAAGVVAVPILLAVVAGFVIFTVIAAVLSVMLPLVPFVLLGLLVWALFFRARPAAAV
jgi:hypothetical protein